MLSLLGYTNGFSQLINRGALITLNDNSLIHVNGDYRHFEGSILNRGKLSLTGDWDSRGADVFSTFGINGEGLVDMAGFDQVIGGTAAMRFEKLSFSGAGVKRLGTHVSASELDLFNAQLATDRYVFHITDPSPESLKRTKGFISTGEGGLKREMESSGAYLFPVGNQMLYRPLIITSATGRSDFTVSLNGNVNLMPGYNETAIGEKLGYINKNYYYKIERGRGTDPVQLDVFYSAKDDKDPDNIIKWDPSVSSGVFLLNISNQTSDFGDGLDGKLSAPDLKDFTSGYFLLGRARPLPVSLTIANVFSPNNDGINDKWYIRGIEKYPVNELKVFNRWGAEIFSKKDMKTTDGWNGADEVDGTYFYILKVKGASGNAEVIKGYVTVIR
ncbi:MAG TPA: gliding motility-associated C-terminal domain-containing protein [Sphingobacteriaceae bacterium]